MALIIIISVDKNSEMILCQGEIKCVCYCKGEQCTRNKFHY